MCENITDIHAHKNEGNGYWYNAAELQSMDAECIKYTKQCSTSTKSNCNSNPKANPNPDLNPNPNTIPIPLLRNVKCGQLPTRPSDVYHTGRPTKLTALETISR